MSNHLGSEGKVFVGGNQVAEVTGWSFDETTNLVPDNELSDTEATHKAGLKSVTGQIECSWDETDTLAQGAMVNGASVTLKLSPEGDESGDIFWTGTATIHQITRAGAIDSIVNAVYSFTVNGSWTRTAE